MTVLRVLIEPHYLNDGRWYVAQCLEYDLVVRARTAREAETEFRLLLRTRLAFASERNLEDPFSGVKRAPKRFEEAWGESLRIQPSSEMGGLSEIELRRSLGRDRDWT
jgi:hypothetical protein